jgi:hypothetical protein
VLQIGFRPMQHISVGHNAGVGQPRIPDMYMMPSIADARMIRSVLQTRANRQGLPALQILQIRVPPSGIAWLKIRQLRIK